MFVGSVASQGALAKQDTAIAGMHCQQYSLARLRSLYISTLSMISLSPAHEQYMYIYA